MSRYDGKSFVTFSTAQGLANNNVRSIAEDKTGNLWFGTYGGGVSRYDGNCEALTNTNKKDKKEVSKSFVTFSTAQGLSNNSVWSIAEDKTGNLWFGTSEGLSVMSADQAEKLQEKPVLSEAEGTDKVTSKSSPGEGNSSPSGFPHGKERSSGGVLFQTFTKIDGLPDNVVTQVLQMPDGKMAVGTNLGITLFKPSGDFTKLNDIEIFNSLTGYPIKDVNTGQNCMLLDSKGSIWAGTGSEKTALVRFDPSALHSNKNAPTLLIKSIKVNEENICWNDLSRKPKVKSQKSSEIDSMVTPAYITEEVTTIGKAITERERDSMKNKFSEIEFDGITRFYSIPEHLVLPYGLNYITIDFNAVETDKPKLVILRKG